MISYLIMFIQNNIFFPQAGGRNIIKTINSKRAGGVGNSLISEDFLPTPHSAKEDNGERGKTEGSKGDKTRNHYIQLYFPSEVVIKL